MGRLIIPKVPANLMDVPPSPALPHSCLGIGNFRPATDTRPMLGVCSFRPGRPSIGSPRPHRQLPSDRAALTPTAASWAGAAVHGV